MQCVKGASLLFIPVLYAPEGGWGCPTLTTAQPIPARVENAKLPEKCAELT